MRPFVRQSTRLATSSRVRQSSIPRRPDPRHQRTFTTSVQRSSDPRSPANTSEHSTAFNNRNETSHRQENETQKEERKSEGESEEVKSPAESTRKSRIALSRRKQANDVPKPPPIPQWFLDQNVRLVEDTPGLHQGKYGSYKTIRCLDAETGHTLFTIPYWDARVDFDALRARIRLPTHLADDAYDIFRIYQACRLGDGLEKTKNTSFSDLMDGPRSGVAKEKNKPKAIDGDFFDQKFDTGNQSKKKAPSTSASRANATFVPGQHDDIDGLEWHTDPMAWFYMEAEASIRAGFSLADSDRRSTSFAADRVDLSLQCPDSNSHDQLDDVVHDLAGIVGADLIRLDANDLADLTEDFVAQGDDNPTSLSNLAYDVFGGYVANATSSNSGHRRSQDGSEEENDMDEDMDEADEHDDTDSRPNIRFATAGDLYHALVGPHLGRLQRLRSNIENISLVKPQVDLDMSSGRSRASTPRPSDVSRDDARLEALLDSLFDAATEKRSGRKSTSANIVESSDKPTGDQSPQPISRLIRMHPHIWRSQTAWLMTSQIHKMQLEKKDGESQSHRLDLSLEPHASSSDLLDEVEGKRKTIIHVRDLRDILKSRQGAHIARRLARVVRKRRRAGERIVLVGTTSGENDSHVQALGDEADEPHFRTLAVPPIFQFRSLQDRLDFRMSPLSQETLASPAYRRILEINLRHIQTMLRRMSEGADVDLRSAKAHQRLNFPGMHFLTERVLSMDEVQGLSLLALGLSKSYLQADQVTPLHVVLAAMITLRNDHVIESWPALKAKRELADTKSQNVSQNKTNSTKESSENRIERLKKSCNSHETRLLSGVVDPQNIKTRFEDVHAPTETIDALKTLTSLSLLRPDAFKYGVLANDRLPGLLLYGPPGTGKTLLAKAVAKESRATVLEISGAQIYEKYVGEGEKMVRAVFSLAKKLSPCVVFIDEADSIFGNRGNHSNRNTHREIINQFLREWDGMDDHGVFMMVASNRPFDLDDAVLRRLPRRVLVDLPVAKDRESILGIHLRNESLDSSVSLSKLAEQTPLYSGSDLKNLSVAAALACVREENELSLLRKDDTEFKLPDKRTLTSAHFDKALAEISASINEDMSSLAAIRKFDEQYGDRKGRRKKSGYGFGAVDGVVDETAARVRQSSPPPP